MDSAIAEAYKKYEEALLDEESYRAYWMRRKVELDSNGQRRYAHDEGKKEGRAEGLAEGRAEGVEQTTLEIARKMKAMALSVIQITEATGLTFEEIERL